VTSGAETVAGASLLQGAMPAWDARERHRIRVRASPERVYAALRTTDLGAHPLVRAMLALRVLPAALANPDGIRTLRARARRALTLNTIDEAGFRVLAEDPPRELLIGLEGAFWRPGGDLRPVDPHAFAGPVPAGVARAAWNFAVADDGVGGAVLSTETRVLAGDAAARRSFLRYWVFVRPGSGLIRRLMLRAVRREAERGGGVDP
jgi:hypothetical protein